MNKVIRMYRKFFKRPFDVFFSFISLLIFSPVLLIIYLLVRKKLGRPVFFTQLRPGKNEEIFRLYKFRTMTNECDEKGILLSDELRLTEFGAKLRSTSLDELPELLNILKGDMSFVGPRPLLADYLPLYNEQQRKRHSVRPGLTSLAAVNGRNALSWDEKFNCDNEYINMICLSLDISIILKTIVIAIKGEGINSAGEATCKAFGLED